jgi:hypothetical protein
MHPIGINKAEEDDFLLLIPFASATLTVLFPYLEELTELVEFDYRPAPIRKRIMQFYRECVSRQLYLHGGGPLSANVSETLRPFAITVGRWKVTNDGRREGTHDIERASGPRRGG